MSTWFVTTATRKTIGNLALHQSEPIIDSVIAQAAPELAVFDERMCDSLFGGAVRSHCKKRYSHASSVHCDPRTGAYWDNQGGIYIKEAPNRA